MEFKCTIVYQKTLEANTRFVVHQGGARSSKTYSIIQYLITKAIQSKVDITIARSALTILKDTAYKDFIDIISVSGLSQKFTANLTTLTYTLKSNGSTIQFIGLDDPLKLHGRKQDYFWFNEANYCTYEDFKQVNTRTSTQILLDFNPSDLYHWIYDRVLTRAECTLIKSTYRDNPFLPGEIKAEIEAAKLTDPDYYTVYGLGERASSKSLIYPKYEYYHEEPQGCAVIYGLDFGYNDPCALIKCSYKDGQLYWRELIYQSYLTTPELVTMLKGHGIKNEPIHADSSRPEIIKELRQSGFNVHEATKYIKQGIDKVKSQQLFIQSESANLIKEVQTYKWKVHKATDLVLDEPEDKNNHAMDAARYGTYHLVKERPTGRVGVIRIRN